MTVVGDKSELLREQHERSDDIERTDEFENVLGIPFTHGNRITILRNGDRIFPAMLEAIDSAQQLIEFATFVYWTGDIAERFAKALADRARDGVTVMVLLDSVGARTMRKELIETMRNAGVKVNWFRPIFARPLLNINHRTHRKVLVCDGKIGFTGGVGIAKEWEGDARNSGEWRETHFRIEGPAVAGLRAAFLGNWLETDTRWGQQPRLPVDHGTPGTARIQVVRTSSTIGWGDAATTMRLIAAIPQRNLRICTAYFVPDEEMIRLLCDATSRGVEVDVILPGPHTDERFCQLAGEAIFEPLLNAGIRIWQFQPTMLHTKIITVDDELANIGSANLNHRSMHRDDEVCLNVLDREVVRQLNEDFENDLARSERTTLKDWKKRGWWQRSQEAVARIFRHEM